MAFTTMILENPRTGKIKRAPVGFSWTVLFFGCLPAIFRGDWKWALLMTLLITATFGLGWFVFMFKYNKLYITDLIRAGYQVKAVELGTVSQVSQKLGMHLPILVQP